MAGRAGTCGAPLAEVAAKERGFMCPSPSVTDKAKVPVATISRRTPEFVDLGALEDFAPPLPHAEAESPRVELCL